MMFLEYAIGIVSDERHVLCTTIQADHQRILQLVHAAQRTAIVPQPPPQSLKQKPENFTLKRIEWYSGIERDADYRVLIHRMLAYKSV